MTISTERAKMDMVGGWGPPFIVILFARQSLPCVKHLPLMRCECPIDQLLTSSGRSGRTYGVGVDFDNHACKIWTLGISGCCAQVRPSISSNEIQLKMELLEDTSGT
jgi:hypothetical protein